MLRARLFTSHRTDPAVSAAGPALAAAVLWAAAAASVLLWWLHRPSAAVADVAPAGMSAAATPAPQPEAVARAYQVLEKECRAVDQILSRDGSL